MSWAVISITRGGSGLGNRLQQHVPGLVHYAKYRQGDGKARPFDGTLYEVAAGLFSTHDIIIFIMATGIVVRTIAGLLAGKVHDPGIVVIDEKGTFVISLLSGHAGGANRAAGEIARYINAVPVITTASDLNNMLAPDMLAQQYNCIIDDMQKCKEVTAVMVNGGTVGLISDSEISLAHPYTRNDRGADAVVYLTRQRVLNEKRPYVHLVPRTLCLGIGCKRGTDGTLLVSFIKEELDRLGVDHKAVNTIASIDIKRDEQALHYAADTFHCTLQFFSGDEIRGVEHLFEQSAFVLETVEVGSVSEPAAYLASHGKGSFLLNKKIKSGMTLSITELPLMEKQ